MDTKGKNKYEIDMCNGPLLGKLLLFSVPVILSGVLQLLFNAADIVVVGRYAGNTSLAAVGSTSSLINLMTNLFIGLSVGANVLVARYYGAGQKKELSEMVHTAILTSALCGVVLIFVGAVLAEPALRLMDTPEDCINQAILYIRIYFIGMPVSMLYNFGSAILRAVGDTKRPLYYLSVAGVVNVILNLIFVTKFHLDVAGVAIATVISQTVSAALVIRCLILTESDYRLVPGKLRIVKDKLWKMIQIGLPAGLQGSLFSISNVLIQSSVNSFGSIAMAGNAAAGNVEGFVYTAMNSMSQTAISFTGQNYGASKFKRIGRVAFQCLVIVMIIGLVMGNTVCFFAKNLLGLYSKDAQVIEFGILRLSIICTTYCLCGMMDVMVGVMRGMGHSVVPMLVSLTGACLFRVVWIYTVFKEQHTLFCLYLSYPISWAVTFLVHLLCFSLIYRNLLRKRA